MASTSTPPRIYVGTHAKYNNGSIEGAWLDLEDYSDAETFEQACQELHGTGEHEFMFQDWEGIPVGMVSESSLSSDFWDWVDLDDSDKQLLAVYRDNVDQSGTFEQAQEVYAGTYASPADWAEEFLTDIGALSEVPENLRAYFNFESYARDAGFSGVTFAEVGHSEVWVFHNC